LEAALKRVKQRLHSVIEHGIETGRATMSRAAFAEAAKVADSKITILLIFMLNMSNIKRNMI
jgi:hypothetical protein